MAPVQYERKNSHGPKKFVTRDTCQASVWASSLQYYTLLRVRTRTSSCWESTACTLCAKVALPTFVRATGLGMISRVTMNDAWHACVHFRYVRRLIFHHASDVAWPGYDNFASLSSYEHLFLPLCLGLQVRQPLVQSHRGSQRMHTEHAALLASSQSDAVSKFLGCRSARRPCGEVLLSTTIVGGRRGRSRKRLSALPIAFTRGVSGAPVDLELARFGLVASRLQIRLAFAR